MDATPRAPTRQAMYSIGSRPRLQISAGPPQGRCASIDGQDSALPFVPLPGRPGITGSVDATPTWSCASLVLLACGLRVQVTRSVVKKPRPSASALASNSQPVCCALTGQLGFGVLGGSPVSPPCVVLCRLVCAHNVPKIVLGELIPPIPVIPVGTNAHGEGTEVTWAVSLPPSKRRPALHHAVDLAIALPLPRDSPVLRVTSDRLLTIASWCGKHESSSCIRMCLHSSQQLLVVLHTAQCIRSVAAVTMPSPAAKLKAARRLRLRLSAEGPQGDIARMGAEATARYERGESSSSTLHSCLQRPRAARTDGNPDWRAGNTWSWNAGWDSTWHSAVEWRNSTQDMGMAPYEQETEASSWYWTSSRTLAAVREKSPNRPLPPRPPSPRRQRPEQVWKARAGEVDKTTADTIPRATSPALGVVKSRLHKPQSGKPEKVACARWQRRHRHCPRCRSDLGPS